MAPFDPFVCYWAGPFDLFEKLKKPRKKQKDLPNQKRFGADCFPNEMCFGADFFPNQMFCEVNSYQDYKNISELIVLKLNISNIKYFFFKKRNNIYK